MKSAIVVCVALCACAKGGEQITADEVQAWNDAADAGVRVESDPLFEASPAHGITQDQVAAWNEAHQWGNHATAGYLKTETEPAFSASPASAIAASDVASWNTAVGWGDHAQAGYLKAETEPQFSASAARSIAASDVASWNTAAGWGNHATAGYLKSESDPLFSASPAARIGAADVSNWSAAYGWGNHASAGYLKSESDPQFNASVAKNIAQSDVDNWNATSTAMGQLGWTAVPHWEGKLTTGALTDNGTSVGVFKYADPAVDVVLSTATTFATVKQFMQTFVPQATGTLAEIDFQPAYFCAFVDGTLTVFDGALGSGQQIYQQTFSTQTGRTCDPWEQLFLGNGPVLTAGNVYSFRFDVAGGATFNVSFNETNAYGGGDMWSDSYGEKPLWDLAFRTYLRRIPTLAVNAQTNAVGINVDQPARALHVRDVLRLEPRSAPPPNGAPGDLYYDGVKKQLCYCTGGSWNCI